MKRVTLLASGLLPGVVALMLGQACSSDDSDQAVDNPRGTGAAPSGAGGTAAAPAPGNSGATPAPGMSAGVAVNGTSSSESNPALTPPAAAGSSSANSGANAGANAGAMAAAAGAGGSSMAGGAGGAAPAAVPGAAALCPAQATSPSDGVACTVTCTDPCGIKNLGARLCTCADGAFDCASCDYAGVENPLLVPPTEPLANCPLSDDLQEDDETGCVDNQRCQSIGRTPGAADGGNRFCGCLDDSWDCDTKPASFGG